MLKITLENKEGNTLELLQHKGFAVAEVQGLNPPNARINTSETALIDGAKFNSSKVNMRSLNMSFYIEFDAARKRLELFKVVKTGQYIKLHIVTDLRDVYIEGYVEACDIDYFGMKQFVTLSVLCPSSFFKNVKASVNELINVVKGVHFPLATTEEIPFSYAAELISVMVENDGDVETGLIVDFYARSEVVNPKLFDYVTGEFIGVNFTMNAGDLITIDTRKGEKTVKLLRNGEYINIFNYLADGSKWLQLSVNGGAYTVDVESGASNLVASIKHYDLYEGV